MSLMSASLTFSDGWKNWLASSGDGGDRHRSGLEAADSLDKHQGYSVLRFGQ
jgi:hypothetical protein